MIGVCKVALLTVVVKGKNANVIGRRPVYSCRRISRRGSGFSSTSRSSCTYLLNKCITIKKNKTKRNVEVQMS